MLLRKIKYLYRDLISLEQKMTHNLEDTIALLSEKLLKKGFEVEVFHWTAPPHRLL